MLETSFKSAAIGQAGQVILIGTATRLIQSLTQVAGLRFAADHLFFDHPRALQHDFGDGSEFGDYHAGLAHLFQLANMGFQCSTVFTGRGAGFRAGFAKVLNAGFKPLHQRNHYCHLVVAIRSRDHFVQPLNGYRSARQNLAIDQSGCLGFGLVELVVGNDQRLAGYFKSVKIQETRNSGKLSLPQ